MLSKKAAAAAAKLQFRNQLKANYAIEELEFSFSEGAEIAFEKLEGFAPNSILLIQPRLAKAGTVAGYSVLQVQKCPGTKPLPILETLFMALFAIKKTANQINGEERVVTDFSQKYLGGRTIYKTNSEGKINRALAVKTLPNATVNAYGILEAKRETLRSVGVKLTTQEVNILSDALRQGRGKFIYLLQEKAKKVWRALEYKESINRLYLKLVAEKDAKAAEEEAKLNANLPTHEEA